MSGSENSNFGYANINPYGGNVNPAFVNKWSSNNPANFSSNEISGLPGLSGAKNNVLAAAGVVPGIALYKGGAKKIKRKIKNITKSYKTKMYKNKKSAKKYARSVKSRIKAKYGRHHKSKKSRTIKKRRNTFRGGYSQYFNNFPNTPSFSVGGVLGANSSALANPPPIQKLPNCVNCVDNYDHFTGKGSASLGH